MDIIAALKQEEVKLQRQLAALQGAITALNGGLQGLSSRNGSTGRRTMSAEVRARISRTAKARWARIRAEKAKKTK